MLETRLCEKSFKNFLTLYTSFSPTRNSPIKMKQWPPSKYGAAISQHSSLIYLVIFNGRTNFQAFGLIVLKKIYFLTPFYRSLKKYFFLEGSFKLLINRRIMITKSLLAIASYFFFKVYTIDQITHFIKLLNNNSCVSNTYIFNKKHYCVYRMFEFIVVNIRILFPDIYIIFN